MGRYRGGYKGWRGRGGRGYFSSSPEDRREFNSRIDNISKHISRQSRKQLRKIRWETFWYKVRKFLGIKPKNNRIYY